MSMNWYYLLIGAFVASKSIYDIYICVNKLRNSQTGVEKFKYIYTICYIIVVFVLIVYLFCLVRNI